jgi:hypothetical protein
MAATRAMPLIWISQCFYELGFPVHSKRYAMLALCEDAVTDRGRIPPETGAYFQLAWRRGFSETELSRYAKDAFNYSQNFSEFAKYPEAMLPTLGDDWLRELPSEKEAFFYIVNSHYVDSCLTRSSAGGKAAVKALEDLAEYLVSCMARCRVKRSKQSPSTEYDLVCSVEGMEVDFRSELGRYFVCECKNSKHPADFTDFAKFCRVLASVKARFGILFGRSGVSESAEHEQKKLFQDSGVVLVVLDTDDLKAVSKGNNLITLLRQRYEMIRLDLSA